MADTTIDFEAVYRALPGMVALLTPGLVFADVNDAYVRGTGRPRASLLGRHVFDVFPESVNSPAVSHSHQLRASLLRVLATGERDAMALSSWMIPARTVTCGSWASSQRNGTVAAVACSVTKPYWQIRFRRSSRADRAVSASPQAMPLSSRGMAAADPVESCMSAHGTWDRAVRGVDRATPVGDVWRTGRSLLGCSVEALRMAWVPFRGSRVRWAGGWTTGPTPSCLPGRRGTSPTPPTGRRRCAAPGRAPPGRRLRREAAARAGGRRGR